MAKTFRVGVLGNQDDNEQSYFGWMYGVEVFDLTADQVCSLLENPSADKTVQATRPDLPAPVMTYQVFWGGRFFPGVSREELSKAVQGMEILIARMSSSPRMYSTMSYEFFEAILSASLSDKCKIVIARIVGAKQSRTTRRGRSTTVKTQAVISSNGLNIEQFKYKGKFFVITDKSKAKTEGKKYSGSKVTIDKVRSELSGEEFKVGITQPVKETVTAGKAIARLGTRLGRWFSSLIKTQ